MFSRHGSRRTTRPATRRPLTPGIYNACQRMVHAITEGDAVKLHHRLRLLDRQPDSHGGTLLKRIWEQNAATHFPGLDLLFQRMHHVRPGSKAFDKAVDCLLVLLIQGRHPVLRDEVAAEAYRKKFSDSPLMAAFDEILSAVTTGHLMLHQKYGPRLTRIIRQSARLGLAQTPEFEKNGAPGYRFALRGYPRSFCLRPSLC